MNDAERMALVEQWAGLPRFVALRLQHHPVVVRLGVDDAEGIGALGLIHAARLFDPSRGFAFSTYATVSIRRYILQHGREQCLTVHVPVYLWDGAGRGGAACKAAARAALRPMPRLTGQEEGELAPDGPWQEPIDWDRDAEGGRRLAWALGQMDRLPARERSVLLRRMAGETLKMVGARLGVTKEAIRLIQNRALRKLREWARKEGVMEGAR